MGIIQTIDPVSHNLGAFTVRRVLPSPRRYSAHRPGPYVQRRARWIERNVRRIGGTDYLEALP